MRFVEVDVSISRLYSRSIILETAVGRKKDVQAIGVHGEIQKVVVTLVVMRPFCILSGAPRGCADFLRPTAVPRITQLMVKMALFQTYSGTGLPLISFRTDVRNLPGDSSRWLK